MEGMSSGVGRCLKTLDVSATLRVREGSGITARLTSFLALARLGLLAATVAACGTASSYLAPSGSTTTLMAGWERRFTIDWTVEPEQGGFPAGPWPRHQPTRGVCRAGAPSGAGARLVWSRRGAADRV